MLSQKQLKQRAMESACNDIFMYELINILEQYQDLGQKEAITQIKNDLICLKPYLLETFEDLNNVLIQCKEVNEYLYAIECIFIGNYSFSFKQHIGFKNDAWEITQ